MIALPASPYRGIQEFRYADHAIFFARAEETRHLANLVAVYRGVMLYGDSGNGKSSLVNAGLLPEATSMGFTPERVRVQPRTDEELVVERIAVAEDGSDFLPSCLAADDDESPRVVLSTEVFEERVRSACEAHRPLLVFDQFEELLTLFEEANAGEAQRRVVATLMTLLREPLPVKLVFAFREDYLGKVKQLLAAAPELVDQALRLGSPAADSLPTIIRGPFDHYPGHFERELSQALAERLRVALADRFGTGDLSLSEVQTVCLRLWQSNDPDALLTSSGVQGLLEAYLGEELDAFPAELKDAAVLLLSEMVTSAGTRNVISAEDLVQRVQAQEKVAPEVLQRALHRLEGESKLIRRERRRDTYLYEITSEFLVPWISERRDELRRRKERRKDRRRAAAFLLVAAVLAGLLVWALAGQRAADRQAEEAERQAKEATALALAASSTTQLASRPEIALLLGLEAFHTSERSESRTSALTALNQARTSGLTGILNGHGALASDVAFGPDPRILASAGWDKTIRLWDLETREQIATLTGHRKPVNSIAFSRDGRQLASASEDRTIRIWDVATRRPAGEPIRIGNPYTNVAFSPDGRTVAAVGRGDAIRFWDVRTHEETGAPLRDKDQSFNRVAFSPDGRLLATGGSSSDVELWNVRTRERIGRRMSRADDDIIALAFSPDGDTIAASGYDDVVRLWDVRTQRLIGRGMTGHTDGVTDVVFSRDGRKLVTSGIDKTIRIWDVRSHKELNVFTGHTDLVAALAFSSDGRTLASASGDESVRLWGVPVVGEPGRVFRVDPDRTAEVEEQFTDITGMVATSPGGRTLAIADFATMVLWDSRARKVARRLDIGDRSSSGVAFSPDGRTVALADNDGDVALWDIRTGEKTRTLHGRDNIVQSENAVAFRPDGHVLAAGDDQRIRLWDLRTGDEIGQPLVVRYSDGYPLSPTKLAFSPNGRTLATGTEIGTIVLWDVVTRRKIGSPMSQGDESIAALAFSPDGRTLAAASDDADAIVLWDVKTRRKRGPALAGHDQDVTSVAFSPDGRTLASGSDDRTVRLWDVRTRTPLGPALTGHTGPVGLVAFTGDGRTLLSYSSDGTARLWEGLLWRSYEELRDEVCGITVDGLDEAQWKQYAPGIPYRDSCP